jgi:hypothetical protein
MRCTDSIQGNEIYSYEVDIKNGRLILHTQAKDSKRADVCFHGVLAHDFNNVQSGQNAIRDIETLEFPHFLERFRGEVSGWLKCGFPVSAENEAELEKKMKKEKLNIYAVNASAGMAGVVFAKAMEVQSRVL